MLTVVTPTVAGREILLAECVESVKAAGLPHLVEVDEYREGPAAVRNRLVEKVITPWVLFVDDDDVIYPHYFETVRPHLSRSDVVYTSWDLSGAIDPTPYPWFDPDLLRHHNVIPVTACVRVRAFRSVGGFSDVPLEDHDLWLRLLDRGARFTYVPTVCWHYRQRENSRTNG